MPSIIKNQPMWLKRDLLIKILSKKMLSMIFLGFNSGLPLLLTGSTLQAWMTDSKIDIKDIGYFALVGLPYATKFLWAPLLDRYQLFSSRRKGWMTVFQIGLVASLFIMAQINPSDHLMLLSILSLSVAFFSASQDIVIDAYRREVLSLEELGLGNSLYIFGYRMAMLISGALALSLADMMSWTEVYTLMSVIMSLSLVITYMIPTESHLQVSPKTLSEAVIGPFVDFLKQPQAWLILLFILFYKMGDTMAGHLTTPFILSTGFSKTDIAAVAKTFGMVATICGGLAGGILILKLGIMRSLWIFGFLQAFSTLGFCLLTYFPASTICLSLVIGFENLCAGLGTSAYAAFMASKTNIKYSGTQLALLTSFMGIPRVILAAPTGLISEAIGWNAFFIFCTIMAIPGMILIPWIKNQNK